MKKGAVAFLDILGFRGIWQSRSEAAVLKLMLDVPALVAATYKAPDPGSKWPQSSAPVVTLLSDTIVVTIDSEEPACLLLIGQIVYQVMHHFLKEHLFVRGALGWGEYMQDGSVFLGPTIDDVAGWYERADWIGVITTPQCNYIIDHFSDISITANGITFNQFIKYDVPLKNGGTATLNAFNWPGILQASFDNFSGHKSEARALLEREFSKQQPFDASVLSKYEHTLQFVDFAVEGMRRARPQG